MWPLTTPSWEGHHSALLRVTALLVAYSLDSLLTTPAAAPHPITDRVREAMKSLPGI